MLFHQALCVKWDHNLINLDVTYVYIPGDSFEVKIALVYLN